MLFDCKFMRSATLASVDWGTNARTSVKVDRWGTGAGLSLNPALQGCMAASMLSLTQQS